MRTSHFLTTLSLFSTFTFASASSSSSSSLLSPSLGTSPAPIPANTTATSPHPDHHLEKRTLCILGLCLGGSNYDSDVNNCGRAGYRCPTNWLNGGGATCSAGVCGPSYCNNLFDFNWGLGKCQDVSSDPVNCGKCGQVCSVANAASTTCLSGQCYAKSCNPGYTLSSGTCTKTIDTTSDMNNCGALGNKCPTSFSNGWGAVCKNSICQPLSCNSGFSFDYGTSTCRNLLTDPANCGSLGNVCAFPFGSGTCSSGVCKLTSCKSGYYNINGVCTSLNLQSDVNNCGSIGNKCNYANGVASCSGGSCQLTGCQSGYELKTSAILGFLFPQTTCQAVDTSSDENNCGSIGNKCIFNNGIGACNAGKCQYARCNSGFQLVNNVCTSMDLTSDVNNCGSVGNKCSFGLGSGTCSSGKCTYTSCNSPYALQSGSCNLVNLLTDPKNCGTVGNVCPSSYSNGGTGYCLLGKCTTTCSNLFDFDVLLGFCRDVSSDTNNCGKCGAKCSLPGAIGTTCKSGTCLATACQTGYTLQNGACTSVNLATDVNNCGALGNVCQFLPSGASGVCSSGKCQLTGCPSGYALTSGVCVKSTASQRARAKKSKIVTPKSLCPSPNEVACPIVGSSSYQQAVAQHFTSATEFSGVFAGEGGYECLDVTQALDSCGGCASTGEGEDCTKIRGAVSMGCESSKCVVYSCEAGWKPALSGSKCVRVRSHSSAHNSTAKRHLSARNHAHHLSHGAGSL
ncbi:uncharacterized protein JCM6883_000344 [Sporobolomyces salmoneus]|uniref:uncharacterized protein n=1 Tax=Sporobolomyces salmoneus TaxID=183962 RepID=UPI00316F5E84